MAKRKNRTYEEIVAAAMQRADAEYKKAVERGKARYAREQAREAKRREKARVCSECGEPGVDPCDGCGKLFCGSHIFLDAGGPPLLCWVCSEAARED